MFNQQQATERRDDKLKRALGGVAPLWLVFEEYRAPEESFYFDLVYQNAIYGWMRQRYKYDAFNDVLYHFGEKALPEAEALAVQDTQPYIDAEVVVSVPNNPKPRQ